jgi:hypothetical protein
MWCAIVQLAMQLTARLQMIALHNHPACRWEPKRLRLRLFSDRRPHHPPRPAHPTAAISPHHLQRLAGHRADPTKIGLTNNTRHHGLKKECPKGNWNPAEPNDRASHPSTNYEPRPKTPIRIRSNGRPPTPKIDARRRANCPDRLGKNSRPGSIAIRRPRDMTSRYRWSWIRRRWKVQAHWKQLRAWRSPSPAP